ncbi:MAG TPA: polyprenol monophosphomannose synthase [Candidatus Paceibacterota bacterium]|nr:polyprenol monophosphomannose synthase [Candidatus Paceibacterota bacterium]
MRTVIVIPTYNERENIRALIGAVAAELPDADICVVDDNSPDGTGEEVRELMGRFLRLRLISREKKEGLGRAYTHAFRELLSADSGFEAIIMMDADFSHHPSYLPAMLAALDGADIAIGSRYIAGGRTIGWEPWRQLLSWGGNLYTRLITGLPMHDMTAGFNAIRTDALRKVDLDGIGASGYAFQIELKHALVKSGARAVEIPIVFTNRINGESKIAGHIIKEGMLTPWRIRFPKLFV